MSQAREEPDFEAFMEAVSTMEIGRGVNSAACHHSAVEIRDWHRIQQRLKEAEAQVGMKQATSRD